MATLTPNFSLRKPAPADTVNVVTDIADNMAAIDTAIAARATAADITAAVNALVASAPGALDTLNELATALGGDAAFSTTVTNSLAGKVALSTIDAAGDLLVGTADNTVGRLGKGTALQQLRVNSGATALEWATVSAGISIDGAGTSAVAAAHSGDTVTASSTQSIAIGKFASANTGAEAIAIGGGVSATAAPTATAQGGIAIGASDGTAVAGARASAVGTVAIGSGDATMAAAAATSTGAIAIGRLSQGNNLQAIAVGDNATAGTSWGIALGSFATCSTANETIAIGSGQNATQAPGATAQGAIAIGASNGSAVAGARASGANSVAIGSGDASVAGASATHATSIVLGKGAASTATNQIRLGTSAEDVNIPGTLTLSGGAVTAGAWTTYVPTLTQSGTVTKTDTYAKYARVGKTIFVTGVLTCTGSGTGANDVVVGLPVTAASAGFMATGSGYIQDASAGPLNYCGIAVLASTTTLKFANAQGAATTGVLGTAGFTAALASGDVVTFCAQYEAA